MHHICPDRAATSRLRDLCWIHPFKSAFNCHILNGWDSWYKHFYAIQCSRSLPLIWMLPILRLLTGVCNKHMCWHTAPVKLRPFLTLLWRVMCSLALFLFPVPHCTSCYVTGLQQTHRKSCILLSSVTVILYTHNILLLYSILFICFPKTDTLQKQTNKNSKNHIGIYIPVMRWFLFYVGVNNLLTVNRSKAVEFEPLA